MTVEIAAEVPRDRDAIRALLIGAFAGSSEANLVVLGDPAYYGRFGFDPACVAEFDCAFAGPALQGLELTAGALGPGGGIIRYPSPFHRFEREKDPA